MSLYKLIAIDKPQYALLLQWRNLSRVRKYLFQSKKISKKEHQQWCENALAEQPNHYRIFTYKKNPVGFVGFKKLEDKTLDWGFYLGVEDLPKGIAYQMGLLAIDYAFKKLKCQKIVGYVLNNNLPSLRYHLQLGFNFETVLKTHRVQNKTFHQVWVFVLDATSWKRKRKNVVKNLKIIFPGIFQMSID